MDINRHINIILAELGNENLKTQDKLEACINQDIVIEEKIEKVKSLLFELVKNDMMLEKFQKLISANKN